MTLLSKGYRLLYLIFPTVLLSEHAKRSIQIGGNDFWNDLPIEIKTNESLNGFKKQFKKYLLEQS